MDSSDRRPFQVLKLPAALREALIAHARSLLPQEACGVVAGSVESGVGRATRHFPIRNDLASPTEYLTNPRQLLDAMKAMRQERLEVLAFYHSHPASEPRPSCTDLARNYWGESAVHLIVGFAGEEAEVRAWWLGEAGAEAADLQVV